MHASLADAAAARARAAGLRRPSPAARAALAAADGFAGLPDGVTRWRLAAALRAAARPLRLSPSMLALLEHYIDLTYDVDWSPGAEPLVIRPLIEVAEHFAKSERQIRNLERALAERGLLAWRDSGNHHRKGRRDRATGRIVWGYGPSLAPLGRRAAEILRLAETARAELAELRRTRLAISALRRRVREAAALAPEDPAAEAALAAMAQMPERNPAGAPLAVLKAQRDRLIMVLGPLRQTDLVEDSVESAPEAEISSRRNTVTRSEKPLKGTSSASEDRRRVSVGIERIGLGLVEAAAGPLLRAEMEAAGGGWPGLVAAGGTLGPLMGVAPAAWGEACGALGRNAAALCLLLLERGLERREGGPPPIERPAAYFDALVARGRAGRLRLDRSLFALARRTQTEGAASGRPTDT